MLLCTLKVTGGSDAGGTARLVCTSGRNGCRGRGARGGSSRAGERRSRDSGEKKRVMMTEMTNCKMIDRTTCIFVRGTVYEVYHEPLTDHGIPRRYDPVFLSALAHVPPCCGFVHES